MRLSSFRGVGNSGEALLDLVDAADADLVPVEELVLKRERAWLACSRVVSS